MASFKISTDEMCSELTETIINEMKKERQLPELPEWINNKEAMMLLDCKKDKLAELQKNDDIIWTIATGKYLNSRKSILKFLENTSNGNI